MRILGWGVVFVGINLDYSLLFWSTHFYPYLHSSHKKTQYLRGVKLKDACSKNLIP